MPKGESDKLNKQANQGVRRIQCKNSLKIAEWQKMVLDSRFNEIIMTMVLTGRDCFEDSETGDLVLGEPLPLDIRKDYMKFLGSKTIPTPKTVVEKDEGESVGLLKDILSQMGKEEKQRKRDSYEPQILDVDVQVNVEGDVDL
jgi:hypothetical protein